MLPSLPPQPPSSRFDQTKLDQAMYDYYENIGMYYKFYVERLRLDLTLARIGIVLAVVVPIAACIFMTVGTWLLWTFGDALIRSK